MRFGKQQLGVGGGGDNGAGGWGGGRKGESERMVKGCYALCFLILSDIFFTLGFFMWCSLSSAAPALSILKDAFIYAHRQALLFPSVVDPRRIQQLFVSKEIHIVQMQPLHHFSALFNKLLIIRPIHEFIKIL